MTEGGTESAAIQRLMAKMESLDPATLAPPAIEPRTAALAALMVANHVADPRVRARFDPLVTAGLLDPHALFDLPVTARFVMRVLPKLGPDLVDRNLAPPPEATTPAQVLRNALLRVVEKHLVDIDEAHGRVETVRLGSGTADLVQDLRLLADLCRDYAEPLARSSEGDLRARANEARGHAQYLEDVLYGPLVDDAREWRGVLLRATTLLVETYEQVCRAGRFLFHGDKPETRFPSLAAMMRVRRRLRREQARRGPPQPARPVQAPASVAPPPTRRSEAPPPDPPMPRGTGGHSPTPADSFAPAFGGIARLSAEEVVPASHPPPASTRPPSMRPPAPPMLAPRANLVRPPPAASARPTASVRPPAASGRPPPQPRRSNARASLRPETVPRDLTPLPMPEGVTASPTDYFWSPPAAAPAGDGAPPRAPPSSTELMSEHMKLGPEASLVDALEAAGVRPDEAPDTDVQAEPRGAQAGEPRATIDVEVTYSSDTNFYTGLGGLEAGVGLFMATYVVKAPGSRITLALTMPESKVPLELTGRVQWVREFSPSIETPPGMGVALEDVSATNQNLLQRFMRTRAPLFHDDEP